MKMPSGTAAGGRPPAEPRHGAGLLHDRLEALQRRLHQGEAPAPAELDAAFEDLRIALEELEVAEEELLQQNDELVRTRAQVEAERQRYRDLFELAPDGYLVTDLVGTIEEANQAAARLLNASQRALQGKPFAVFVGEADRAAFRNLLSELARGARARDWEAHLRPRGAAPLAAALTAVPSYDARGRLAGLRWLVRDLSARKATEEALRDSEERLRHSQRLEAVGRLAGGIAHSFNNLLAAIGFHAELLSVQLDDGEREHLEEIQKATERAAVLSRQLLAFSRKQVLQPRVLDVNQMLLEMQDLLQRMIGEHISLKVLLDPEAGRVYADFGQLEQVVLNLAVNARDAMPHGGELIIATDRVQVESPVRGVELELPAGSYLELTVSDTGSGMDTEVKARAFEPFFTTKEREKGTGLGLATVYGIVRQSGGNVVVESEPGLGSAFRVYLPRVEEEATEPSEPRPATRALEGSEVVLLVEDEENIRLPAVEVLEAQGYTVLAAGDGTEALSLVERFDGDVHLLVTDVVMPGMSGSHLAEQLLRERARLKVLYISGYPEDAIAHLGVFEGRQSFLQKPFAPGLFLRAVRAVLDGVEAA